jgi:hypothetical protein
VSSVGASFAGESGHVTPALLPDLASWSYTLGPAHSECDGKGWSGTHNWNRIEQVRYGLQAIQD